MKSLSLLILTFNVFLLSAFANEKNTLRIIGSASVYPVVSSIYSQTPDNIKRTHFKTDPVIESVGTGAGFDAFCKQPFGSNSPDIVTASRPITQKELENCKKNNLTQIQRITLGLDGITLAYSFQKSKKFDGINLTVEDLQKALSMYSVQNGEVAPNKVTKWSQIRKDLPDVKITIYGPNSSSGTFDFFTEVVRDECMKNEVIASSLKSNGKDVKAECSKFRPDIYTQLPDQDTTIAQKVKQMPYAIGVVRFAFFENSGGEFKSVAVNGIQPTYETISSGDYKFARPLFIYFDASSIKKVAGMKEFLAQVANYSYMFDASKNSEETSLLIPSKADKLECETNKKLIEFKFNCN